MLSNVLHEPRINSSLPRDDSTMAGDELHRESMQKDHVEVQNEPARTIFFTFPEDDLFRKYSSNNFTYRVFEDGIVPARNTQEEEWVTSKSAARSPRERLDDSRAPPSLHNPFAVYNQHEQNSDWWGQHKPLAPGVDCGPRQDYQQPSRTYDHCRERSTSTPVIKHEGGEAGNLDDRVASDYRPCPTSQNHAWINDLHIMPMSAYALDGCSINPGELHRPSDQGHHNDVTHPTAPSSPMSTNGLGSISGAMWHARFLSSDVSDVKEEGSKQVDHPSSSLLNSPEPKIQPKNMQGSPSIRRQLVLRLVDSRQARMLQPITATTLQPDSLYSPVNSPMYLKCDDEEKAIEHTRPLGSLEQLGSRESGSGLAPTENLAESLSSFSSDPCENALYHTRSSTKLRKPSHRKNKCPRTNIQSTQSTPTFTALEPHDDFVRTEVASGPSSAMKWTEEDIAMLTSLRETGTAWSVIAKRLGRSQRACQLKQTHLRSRAQLCLSTKPKPQAPALGRRKPFFEKNPEAAEALLTAYQAHKKVFWQGIAKEVGCTWTAAERKVMELLHRD